MECSLILYRLTMLPNFTHQRFGYLCEDADQRTSMVGNKQLLMLRQFHALGEGWACSLRLLKSDHIELYLVFRHAGDRLLTDREMEDLDVKIRSALPGEYSFQRVDRPDQIPMLLSLSWAAQATELFRSEKEYTGADYPQRLQIPPQSFYVPFLWTAVDNNMEQICTALMNYPGRAAVEVTLCPTRYLDEEKSWMIRTLMVSTRLTLETAASPMPDTIRVSAIPIVTLRSCSANIGRSNTARARRLNSGSRVVAGDCSSFLSFPSMGRSG